MNRLRPTWLEIKRQAIINNIEQLKQLISPSCLMMSVVKANAYGHGAIMVAQTALAAGVAQLAVATLLEAVELREAGITAPILVLGYTPSSLALEAVRMGVSLTVYDLEQVKVLAEVSIVEMKTATIHVKVNTGMNRLGIQPESAVDFFSQLRKYRSLNVEGVFTHFATSDTDDLRFAHCQLERFSQVVERLESQGLRPPLVHAANSAAILKMTESHFDMVRPGIAQFGLHPDPVSCRLPSTFQPALQWKTEIAQVNHITSGESVGYGQEFMAANPMVIATIPVGYADGFPRRPSNWGHVMVAGKFASILGRVCMDQTMIDITDHVLTDGMARNEEHKAQSLNQGDEVVLIGQQGDAELTVDNIAQQLGTNNYDVVSRILSRVPRIYI